MSTPSPRRLRTAFPGNDAPATPTAPTSELSWDELVDAALDAGASDLHMHVTAQQNASIRARIDGVLVAWGELPAATVMPALNRMRSAADLGTGTPLTVGEGRVRHHPGRGGAPVDMRLTIAPLVGGALKVALRLPAIAFDAPLEHLGFSPENLERVDRLLSAPDGLVLTTGPVGAGKTTTLMAAMARVGGPGRSVVTVEDPVERVVPGADQIEVREQSGFTYQHILKSLLRLDMDALLIGEIRDRETAQHAVQIAKAGRLVLSTLHSGSAVGALRRLHELSALGVLEVTEPVRGVISQRLIRKVHETCAGQGCTGCLGTGYAGRLPLHEVLVVDDELRDAMLAGAPESELNQVAHRGGMRTFSEDADRWLVSATTTAEEVERILGRG